MSEAFIYIPAAQNTSTASQRQEKFWEFEIPSVERRRGFINWRRTLKSDDRIPRRKLRERAPDLFNLRTCVTLTSKQCRAAKNSKKITFKSKMKWDISSAKVLESFVFNHSVIASSFPGQSWWYLDGNKSISLSKGFVRSKFVSQRFQRYHNQ